MGRTPTTLTDPRTSMSVCLSGEPAIKVAAGRAAGRATRLVGIGPRPAGPPRLCGRRSMPLFGAQTRRMLPRLAVCAAPLLQQMTAQCGGKSKHDQIEKYKVEAARAAQLKEATAWCDETGRKGYAAAHRKTDDGEWFWPLVTEGSVNRRLRGEVDNEHPFAAKSVLTPKEEADLVATCKELNEHGQGIDREQLGKMVYDSLLLRPTLNEGRDFTPLSANAEKILTAGRVGKDFFTRFFADHEDLSERKACSEEILRAKWMTPEVSQSHMEKLKATLERAGLLDEHGAIKDPRRVLNSDECPNPWRGTGDRRKTIAAVGAPCVKLDGFLYDAHLIFKGEYVQRQIPEKAKIPNCKISATDKGYQTGSTLLETLKHWDKQLVARGVAKPVVWTTDGHSSRLNTDLLRAARGDRGGSHLARAEGPDARDGAQVGDTPAARAVDPGAAQGIACPACGAAGRSGGCAGRGRAPRAARPSRRARRARPGRDCCCNPVQAPAHDAKCLSTT